MRLRNTHFFLAVFVLCFTLCSPARQTDSLAYLALGDSYTIGESVDKDSRWPVRLAEALRAEGVPISNPEIIAVTGWTTLDLKAALEEANPKEGYALVSLLIGVNDQYQGKDIADYPGNFRYLLDEAIRLAGGRPKRVLVLSIPDYGVTPFGRDKNPKQIAKEIAAYNTINERIADSAGVHYVDITSISKRALDEPSLTASDDLHPSGSMYELWVEEALPVILSELKNPK